MKKLLCIVCLLATVLFVDSASACMNGRCGNYYYGRPSYTHTYHMGYNYGHRYGHRSYGHHYGHRFYGHHYGHRFYGHHYGRRSFGRSYARCTRCGYGRW